MREREPKVRSYKANTAILFLSSSEVCSICRREMFLGEHLEGPWKRKRITDHEKMGKKRLVIFISQLLNYLENGRYIQKEKWFCIDIKKPHNFLFTRKYSRRNCTTRLRGKVKLLEGATFT